MMKAVVIILCVLNLINSHETFLLEKLEISINELVKSDNSVSQECADQLKFLVESFKNEESWASNSEFNYNL